jgi:hypothetical protein
MAGISELSAQGQETRQLELMQKVFSGHENPEVGRMATLLAASQAEGDEGGPATKAYQKAVAEQQARGAEGEEIIEAASKMQRSFGGLDDLAVRLGKGGSAFNKDTFAKERKGYLAYKAAEIYKSGLSSIADSSVLAGGADARSVLSTAGAEGTGLSGSEARKLAKEYNAEGVSDERKAELEEKFEKLATGRGQTAESSVFGGLWDKAADMAADFKSKMVGDEAAAASGDFPDAVEQFAEASRSLQRVAEALGTALPPLLNSGDH